MIKALLALRAWLLTWNIAPDGVEVHLVFPNRQAAARAKSQLGNDVMDLSAYGGPTTSLRMLGFLLKFKYKETVEGEV